MGGPLEGIRVLDLTRVLAGPYATMVLADLGAEVIKVEQPGEGDMTRHMPPVRGGESHYFMSINRNKRGVAVDMKQAEGRQVILDLARHCDVAIENFRPGVARRLGVDYESLRAVRPDVVYCSISAFGQTGPYKNRSAFDVAMQAMGGAMGLTGEPGARPVRMGLPMADLATGLFAALGVLAAVIERQRTGRGQLVDVSMMDSMVGLLTQFAGRYFFTGEDTEPVGSSHPAVSPYGAYETADGFVVIANMGENFWPKIARAIGRPELAEDERYRSNRARLERRDEVDRIVTEATRQHPTSFWEGVFEREDVPHAPVLKVSQVVAHPQVKARGMVVEYEHPTAGRSAAIGRSLRLTGHQPEPLAPPPTLGQHTDEVLRGLLGYPAELLERLRRDGAIG